MASGRDWRAGLPKGIALSRKNEETAGKASGLFDVTTEAQG
jgi:hypothetical protein